MEKYPTYFNKEDSELMSEFEDFVVKVKNYLLNGETDEHFSRVKKRRFMTDDGGTITKVMLGMGIWGYIGIFFNDEPVARSACFHYRGIRIWEMERSGGIESVAWAHHEEIGLCLKEAMKGYTVEDPWHRPKKFDDSNNLHYRSSFVETNNGFELKEIIDDPYGAQIYKSQIKAAFTCR